MLKTEMIFEENIEDELEEFPFLEGKCMRRKRQKKSPENTIEKELNEYSIDITIKLKANDIYKDLCLTRIPRAEPKKMVIFYCLHQAYNLLEEDFIFSELAILCGISRESANKSLSKYGKRDTHKKNAEINTVNSKIKILSKKLGIVESFMSEILNSWEENKEKYSSFLGNDLREIASVFIYIFCINNNHDINKKSFLEVVLISVQSFDKYYNLMV